MVDLDTHFFTNLPKWIIKKKLKGCSYEIITQKYKKKEIYQYFTL